MVLELENNDILYGNLEIIESDKTWIKTYPDNPSFYYFIDDTLPHSGGSLIRRSLFERFGLYDEQLKIVSDWKFFLNAFSSPELNFKHINVVISVFDINGISSKEENKELIIKEKTDTLKELYPFFYADINKLHDLKSRHNLLINSLGVKMISVLKKILK